MVQKGTYSRSLLWQVFTVFLDVGCVYHMFDSMWMKNLATAGVQVNL